MRLVSKALSPLLTLVLLGSASAESATDYFPRNTFDVYSTEWYAEALTALGESPIVPQEGTQTYRFLWLRSFHAEYSVRVDHDSSGTRITSRSIHDDQLTEESRPVSAEAWRSFLLEVEAQKFWLTVPRDKQEYADEGLPWELGLTEEIIVRADGAMWLIEASNGHIYHAADAWSPESGAIRALGIQLLTLADVIVPDKELY